MKTLTFELKVAVQDDAETEEIRSVISSMIEESDHIQDNYLFAHKLRFLRGKYIDGVKDPSLDDITDKDLNGWFTRADKELE